MGIFSDSPQQDIQAISHIVHESLAAYAHENAQRSGVAEYEVTTNGAFDFISEAGQRILQILGFDNAIAKVATLLVLCNSAPPFSVRKHGKLCLDFEARKDFLARFTCLLVHAALSTMEVDRGSDTFVLRWKRFPDDTFAAEFLTYLQWINSMTVAPGKTSKDKKQAQEAYLKLLAHASLGCALALYSCLKEEPVPKPRQLPP